MPAADHGVEDRWVNVAARAGEFWVRLGVLRRGKMDRSEGERELEALKQTADELEEECARLGVTLGAVGFLFKACLSTEFLAAKLVNALSNCLYLIRPYLQELPPSSVTSSDKFAR